MQKNSDITVLSRPPQAGVTAADRRTAREDMEGKFFVSDISWYIPHFTPKNNVRTSCIKISDKKSIFKRSVHWNCGIFEKNWIFEIGKEKEVNVPFCVLVSFLQRDKFHQQTQNNYIL